jgi:hypothetical protein
VAKEREQVEQALQAANLKSANLAKETRREELQQRIIKERKQNAYLLTKLDAIRNAGVKPRHDPPSDPSSSEGDEEPEDWRPRKPKATPHQPPPVINYHQPHIKFPEPPKFSGVGKLPVEKWLAQLDLYFEATGIRVKRTLYAAMLLQDNAATWWMSIRRDGTEPKRWIDFKQQITQQFKNIDSNRRARDRLEGLKQTTSVRNFIKFFEDLIYEIEDIGHSEQYWKF